MDDLLQQGITAYKAGKRDETRKFFITVVKQSPDNEPAWGWMYQASNNDQERIHCLKQILRINPKSEKANQLLNQLLAQPITTNAPLSSVLSPTSVSPSLNQVNSSDIAPKKSSDIKTWEDLDKRTPILQKSINELFQKHTALQSFRDAREWDNDSYAIIDLLQNFKNDWNVYRKEQENILEQLYQERKNRSFINKVLSTRSDENEVKKSIKQVDVEIASIDGIIEKLNVMMDKTPANKSEQKEIADVMKEVKKELTLQKREINENLRQTRANARQKTANWTGPNPGMLGSIARYQRTSIRMEKERALVPMENMKTFIETNLISLEKDLNWVMHFKGNEQEGIISEYVRRCKYCGRRVNTDDLCLGCGAVI